MIVGVQSGLIRLDTTLANREVEPGGEGSRQAKIKLTTPPVRIVYTKGDSQTGLKGGRNILQPIQLKLPTRGLYDKKQEQQ
jgi:hypothetical protein